MANVSKFYVTITELVEKASCSICDLVFVVSENEKKRLVSWNVPEDKIKVIPNSVEIDKFSTTVDGSRIRHRYKLNDKIVIIFHGTLSYPPNEEATKILVGNILPGILKGHDNIRLLLVGKNPPKISHPNIIVTGFVKNLPEYIAAADIAVVPLLKGGGTKIKVLEYMASGKAVVSTLKGAEGLSVEDGKEILLSKRPDYRFVNLVIKLICDKDLRRKLGARARRKIEESYDWERNAEKAALFMTIQNAKAKSIMIS